MLKQILIQLVIQALAFMAEHVWIHQTQLMWHLMPMDTSVSVLRVLEGLIVKVGHLKKQLT